MCNSPLELPSVHFLCSHSFHQHCFENYAESEAECPTCTPGNRKVMDMLRAQDQKRDLHDHFNRQVTILELWLEGSQSKTIEDGMLELKFLCLLFSYAAPMMVSRSWLTILVEECSTNWLWSPTHLAAKLGALKWICRETFSSTPRETAEKIRYLPELAHKDSLSTFPLACHFVWQLSWNYLHCATCCV